MIYYFSGTGNSKYVAEKLAEYTKDSIHFIPTVFDKMEDDLYIQEGEVIGIVFPIYVWAVPEIVQEFLSHVHVHEKAFSYVICTCGLEAGAALQELKKVFPVKSAYSLIMPENYVVLFKTESDERIREKINIASQKIPKIAQEINSRKEVYDVKEGHASLFKTLALNKIFSLVGMNSAFFSVEDTCTSCGLCEKKCPFGVIRLVNGKPYWEGKCQMCMACISYCPSKSIQCGFSKNHGRYVFKQTETKATFFYGDESDVQKAKKLDASLESENIQKNTNSIDSSNEGDCSELKLKYGCNPNQDLARIFINKKTLPISVLNGKAGYINLLDALNGWQLVRELDEMSGLPSATSFKHVSPAGSAIANELSSELKSSYFIDELELSPLATAFARARGSDRMSSFGDFIALSRICDVSTAHLISKEVSDGIIAPDYEREAFDILKSKKKGAYTIIKIDKDFVPEPIEVKTVFGITFEQQRNNCKITDDLLLNIVTKNKFLSNEDKRNLLIALITLKYTQSNSVCFAKDGQAIGIGAGQQSRIHCTRLAASKADVWFLRQAPHVQNLHFVDGLTRAERDNAIDVYINNSKDILEDGIWQKIFKTKPCIFSEEEKNEWLSKNTNVALASDAFFPFSDNIECAKKSGVTVIAEPGGSLRDKDVIEACDKYNIAMAFTALRLFHH